MQLMIDTSDSPRMLRLASQFLEDAALISEGEIRNGSPLMPANAAPTSDEGTVALPVATSFPAAIDLRAAFAQPAAFPGPYVTGEVLPPALVNAVPPPPAPPPSSVANAAAGGTAPFQTPPPAATNATGAAVSTASNDVQLDAHGFPWDARIHSATPTILKDGSWRQRRNLDNPTLVQVEADLIAKGYGKTPRVTIPPPPPPPAAPVIPPPPPPVSAGVAGPVAPPVIPPAPPANPGVAGGLPAGASSFKALMDLIGGHTGENGRLSLAAMAPYHAQFGASAWSDYVVKCKDKIPAITAVVREMLA